MPGIVKHQMLGTAVLAVLVVALAVHAQPPQTARVRGTIESINGQVLSIKARDGATVTVKLVDNAPVRTVVRKALADVKKDGFVGITAMPQPDGTQEAVEIHIFPEAMRGTGEGHRPWDLMPNSTMTNANVDSVVVSVNGETLVLKYKNGEQTFTVPSNVEVVAFAPASMSDLKPGERVFIAAAKKLPDGTLEASNITVGSNGVNPPM